MAAKNKSNEIRLIRVYNAPVKAVWDAWTDPAKAAMWWGPRGFSITTYSKDLKPGGHWKYTMHGPDGTDYPNVTKYHEVEKYSRLVYDHGGTEDTPALFRVTVNFSEPAKGKTKMEMTMTVPTPEALEEIRKIIKKASGESTWDRLAEYLEEENGRRVFVINRAFDAPIETMFEMWTDPKHFAKWLPPTGYEMTFIKADIKPGGRSFYCMPGPGGSKMYGRAHYLEIEKPNRIVYTQQFCDEKENITRHPHVATWPETMLTTVTLTPESEDRTRVTVTWEVHGKATPEEVETFLKMRGGMTQGWTGSFDKLEEYLEK